YLGTNAAGIAGLGNDGDGIIVNAALNNTIGGTTAAARNIISNNSSGVYIVGSNTNGNLVQGNYIGTNAAGNGNLGNFFDGVLIGFRSGRGVLSRSPNSAANISNNSIGGTAAGAGNVIAFNGVEIGNGVTVVNSSSENPSISNPILGNSIFSNRGLGIDLGNNGVTPNDPRDADTGPTNLQNFPVLTSALSSGVETSIIGRLDSAPNQTYRIELFVNTACDPSGNGEGERFLTSGTATTDGNGLANFAVNVLPAIPLNQFITATATDADGNTSEFSACVSPR